MMFAIEGEQFESEFGAEAEELVPEIFEQQEFVPEGKSWSPLITFLSQQPLHFCYNKHALLRLILMNPKDD